MFHTTFEYFCYFTHLQHIANINLCNVLCYNIIIFLPVFLLVFFDNFCIFLLFFCRFLHHFSLALKFFSLFSI